MSCTKPLKCPTDGKLYVWYVTLRKDNPNPETQPREVKNCLMITQLLSEAGVKQNVWDKLLIVEFSSFSEDEIKSILSRGIELDGSQYCFLGFSASQLKTKTCFLIKETEKQVGDRRAKFGILSDVFSFPDRAAKVQHMFEPFERNLRLEKDEFKLEHNASTNVPSGFMSPELAETIKTTCGLAKAPSVVQVICPGFSGKLVLSDEMHTKASGASEDFVSLSRIKALLRIPDAANNCANSLTMGIANCARPYQVGYLDVYSVMFLEELGIKRDYLLGLQSFYLEILENLGATALTHAKYFLRLNGSKIENGMTPDAREKIRKIKNDDINEMQDQDGTKLRVLVSKSREVFGIVDPYHDQKNALKSDECVFIPCLDCLNPQEQEQFEKAEQVLVIPVPCYTSSGIRVLKLVRDKGEYENLKDCLVLPSQTEEQVLADKFFVCWDGNLLPQKSRFEFLLEHLESLLEQITNALPPIRKKLPAIPCSSNPTLHRFEERVTNNTGVKTDGSSTKTKLQENDKFQDELKEYFSTFKSNDGLVSRAKSHFEKFSSLPGRGPSCSECQKLGEYLSPDFTWNAKSYDVVEKYLTKLDKKSFEEPSSDQEEAEDSATQSSTPQPVWREMTEKLNHFIARNALPE